MTSRTATDDGSGSGGGGPEEGTEGDNEDEAAAAAEVEAEAEFKVEVEDGEDEEDGDDGGDRWSVVNVQHPTRIPRSISPSPVNARASPTIVPACETRRIRSCPIPTPDPVSHSLLYSSHPMCDAESTDKNEGAPNNVRDWYCIGGGPGYKSGADLPHVL